MTAERAALAGQSVAVVTVAHALHGIDRLAFYEEARRTLVRGGVVAVWSYALGKFGEPAIDRTIAEFYGTTVGPYWPQPGSILSCRFSPNWRLAGARRQRSGPSPGPSRSVLDDPSRAHAWRWSVPSV